jgi:MHS family proline/betaine transporter-like MFS transporter
VGKAAERRAAVRKLCIALHSAAPFAAPLKLIGIKLDAPASRRLKDGTRHCHGFNDIVAKISGLSGRLGEKQMSSAAKRKMIAATMIGNVIEWYDFAIYGSFAASIGRDFFPREDAVTQLLAAFGVFAVGYLVRPIGGAVIGYIGDYYSRLAALKISVTAMAVPTFLIGLLPGYETLGLAAPLALILLRMIQGLSVGGEYISSMVFIVERAPSERRGLMGAIACCGTTLGVLIGSGVAAAVTALMPTETLSTWGWRIPFLLGILVGVMGVILRRSLGDAAVVDGGRTSPIIETLLSHWQLVMRAAQLSVFDAVTFLVMFVYVTSWLQTADGISPAHALEISTLSMMVILPARLASGWLSDRFGRKPVLMFSTGLAVILALPLFWIMYHPSPVLALLGQTGFGVIFGLFSGTQSTMMIETAPSRIRCTAVGLGHNACLGVVGGLTPLVATWLVERTADELAPAYLIMVAAVMSFLGAWRMKETLRTPLPD